VYWAPEFSLEGGYSYSADLWAMGVCLFEMVCGYFPFIEEEEENPLEIMKKIRKKELVFPQHLYKRENKEMRLFIEYLLEKDENKRSRQSYAELKEHHWFNEFSFVDCQYNYRIVYISVD